MEKKCDVCGKSKKPEDPEMVYLSSGYRICDGCWKTKTQKKYISNSVSGWRFEDLMDDIVKRIVKAHNEKMSYFDVQVRNNLEMFLNALPNGIIASSGSYKGFLDNHDISWS
ncbi:MAG: hypothetical protein GX429_06835 [Bacteroidales bacterium]|nr:hypothetical protein [Bacteroidales bacterium]